LCCWCCCCCLCCNNTTEQTGSKTKSSLLNLRGDVGFCRPVSAVAANVRTAWQPAGICEIGLYQCAHAKVSVRAEKTGCCKPCLLSSWTYTLTYPVRCFHKMQCLPSMEDKQFGETCIFAVATVLSAKKKIATELWPCFSFGSG